MKSGKIREVFERSLKAAVREPAAVFAGAAIAVVLGTVTFGVLAPAMWVGMGVVMMKADKGEKAEIKDIFSFMNKFIPLFLLGFTAAAGYVLLLVFGAITSSGYVFGFAVLAIPLVVLWIYSPFYLAYEEETIIGSLKLSANAVLKNNFLLHIAVVLILLALNLAAMKLRVVGMIISYPLACGVIVYMYGALKRGE